MTIVFFTSLLLISLLLVFKYWEVSTGNRILEVARANTDIFIENQIHKQITAIPNVLSNSKSLSKVMAIGALHGTVVLALSVVQFIEGHLASTVDRIRGRHGIHKHQSVSPFLRKMGEEDK